MLRKPLGSGERKLGEGGLMQEKKDISSTDFWCKRMVSMYIWALIEKYEEDDHVIIYLISLNSGICAHKQFKDTRKAKLKLKKIEKYLIRTLFN